MSKKKKNKVMPSEWSYLFDTEELDENPVKLSIAPGDEENALLTKRLDILSLDALSADLTISRDKGSMIVRVQGSFAASVTQNCVVTTDPVRSEIKEEFKAWYADSEQAVSLAKVKRDKLVEAGQGELPVLNEKDDPEAIIEGKIDLGELVTQYLSLSINPYPHAEGAEFEVGDDEKSDPPSDIRKNPFAALKDWKEKQGGGET